MVRWRRSKKAVRAIQEYLQQHTKAKTIKLSKWINEEVWAHGGKSPPSKLSLRVEIDREKSLAKADLVELPQKAQRKAAAARKHEEMAKKVADKKAPVEEHTHASEAEERKSEEKEKAPSALTPKQEMHVHK